MGGGFFKNILNCMVEKKIKRLRKVNVGYYKLSSTSIAIVKTLKDTYFVTHSIYVLPYLDKTWHNNRFQIYLTHIKDSFVANKAINLIPSIRQLPTNDNDDRVPQRVQPFRK